MEWDEQNTGAEPLRMENEPTFDPQQGMMQNQQFAPQGQQFAPQGQQFAPQGQQFAPQGQQFAPQGTPQGAPTGAPQGMPQGAPAGAPQGYVPQNYIPPELAKPKKKMSKKAKILLFSGIGLLLAAVGTFFILRYIVFTPKKSVKKAFEKTFTSDTMTQLTPLGSAVGIEGLADALHDNGGTVTFYAEVDKDPDEKYTGCGIGAEVAVDPDTKTLSVDGYLADHGTPVAKGQYLYNENESAVTVPDHLNGYITFSNKNILSQLQNLAQLNGKVNSTLNGVSLPFDFDLDFFHDGAGMFSNIKDFFDDIWEDVTVTSEGSKKLDLGSKSRKCDKYKVTIPKKTLEDLVDKALSSYSDLLSESSGMVSSDQIMQVLKSQLKDLEFDVYLYNGKVAAIQASGSISVISYDIDFRFTGDDNLYSGFALSASLKSMGQTLFAASASMNTSDGDTGTATVIKYSVESSGHDMSGEATMTYHKSDNTFDIEGQLLNDGNVEAGIKGKGVFNELTPGKSFQADISEFSIYDDFNTAEFHGSFSVDTTKKNVLQRQSGLATCDLFVSDQEKNDYMDKNWTPFKPGELGVWGIILK